MIECSAADRSLLRPQFILTKKHSLSKPSIAMLKQVISPKLLRQEEKLLYKLCVTEYEHGDMPNIGYKGFEVIVVFHHLLEVVEGVPVLLQATILMTEYAQYRTHHITKGRIHLLVSS